MTYQPRSIDRELDDLLPYAPAVAIDGPKGVGKTETASRRVASVWRMDDPFQREQIRADFALTTLPQGPVLLDEWQKLPQVWDSVRRQVDEGAAPGRFLLTGSATPVDASGTHSGAARILSLRMRPMGLHERGVVEPSVSLGRMLAGDVPPISGTSNFVLSDYADAITASGFPAIVGAPKRLQRDFLDSYLLRVIDRDLPEQGYAVRRRETLTRWLRAYAASSSSTTAYSRLLDLTNAGDGAQPAKTTTIAYRDHLSQIWLLDPVPGWLPIHSAFTQARQAPKHQLADPALAARLLGLTGESLLRPDGTHMLGPLFESIVTLGVRSMAQANEGKVAHLRTDSGRQEVDLIVEGHEGQVVGLEVELNPAVTDREVRHLLWLRNQIPDRVVDLAVITTGPAAYRRPDGVAVIPLALLGA
ncbi:DUF4143 domain-containing protein [Actinomycetaceae bacterium MB13-C1-2]|nr:DUF4143 domain-containing protein [Actinomycetaceae bacterium MB13-C1-2]